MGISDGAAKVTKKPCRRQVKERVAGSSARGRGVYSRATVGRAFSSSYLAGEAAAAAFLPRDFRQRAVRVAAARQAAQRRIDPTLLAVLAEQQAALPASPARDRNLEALAGGRAAVVVSGQQVGLFLGPLYTFYKAATAIAAARAIEAESGVRCVPLFWLQTEDHDFAEIAGCTIAGRDGAAVRLALPDGAAELERASVAHRCLGPEVTALLDAFADLAGETPAARAVVAVLRAHYRPGRTMAAAFAGALGAIFADEGLLFLDPRDARVAALAAPIYRRAITDAGVIDDLLARQEQRLRDAGFDCQVALRAGSPLVFFHARGAAGPRCRLRWEPSEGSQTLPRDSAGDPASSTRSKWEPSEGSQTLRDRGDAAGTAPGGSTVAVRRCRPRRCWTRWRAIRSASRPRRCCGPSSRTRCCRPWRTSVAPPSSATSPSWTRSTATSASVRRWCCRVRVFAASTRRRAARSKRWA